MPLTQVRCFGDSTSDNGAGRRLTSALVRRPEAPAAAFVLADRPAYPCGRFTNGLAAVEVMAAELGAALDDFAVGGALSGHGNYYGWIDRFASTGLLAQVDAFVAALCAVAEASDAGGAVAEASDAGGAVGAAGGATYPAGATSPAVGAAGRADADGLYVVQLAGNDYAAWADGLLSGPTSAEGVARLMAANECEAVRRLTSAGARRFLVIGPKLMPVCPWEVAAGRTGLAGGFTYALNEHLPAELERLRTELGVEIVFFDLVRAWRRVRVAASSYELAEIDRPFIRTFPEYVPGEGDPDRFFFWDESHVTAAVHKVLGEHLAASLPQAWT